MYASKRLQGFVNVPRTWPQTQVTKSLRKGSAEVPQPLSDMFPVLPPQTKFGDFSVF